MRLIRAVTPADVGGIMDLLVAAGDEINGMSSLRPYSDLIEARVERGVASFTSDVSEPGEEVYFFVLEDQHTGAIAGTGAVYAAVGLSEAFYSYRVSTRVFSSRELGVHNLVPTLFLTNDYTGKSEIGSLYVGAAHRGDHAGRLTSLSRLVFIAEHRKRFTDTVFAEMRGFQLPDGTSPFWEGIGRHFFSIPFPAADDMSARGNKLFIAELMPSLPIYVPLLPYSVQDAIGKVHTDTQPALRLLEREGFRYAGYIDIFDGGPTVEIATDDIRAVRDSVVASVRVGDVTGGTEWIVATRQLMDFRAAVASVRIDDDEVTVDAPTADRLQVTDGDTLRCLPLRPPRP